MISWIIYLLFALAGVALFMSVVFMMKDGGKGTRNVKALTFRISICVVLFIIVLIGMGTGKIIPSNTLVPQQTPEQQSE